MNNPAKILFQKLFPPRPEKLFYSIAEASRILNMPKRDIYEFIKQNKIQAVQIEKGGNFRISNEEIKRIMNMR